MKHEKPCKVCNGRSKIKCMICGWKVVVKKTKAMTPQEKLTRDSKREKIMTINQYSHNSLKFENCSTEIGTVDKEIEKHRTLAQEIWDKIQGGRSVQSVAKEHDLTPKQVKYILASALMQQNLKLPSRPQPDTTKPIDMKPIYEENRRIREARKDLNNDAL